MEFQLADKEYELLGIIGINQSPTCSISKDRGIFMEYLIPLLCEVQEDINIIDVSVDYDDSGNNEDEIDTIKKLLFKTSK